jgi:N-acetylglucosaminyldiphosphoundecaprenol N-acetyl-beta-D-mannosaminyltransferase
MPRDLLGSPANPAPPPLDGPIRLMGMPISPVTQRQAIARIIDTPGGGGWAITPNLDQLRLYCEDPSLQPMYEQADLVLADGMPLIWAARLQRTPLPQRVPGSELIYTLTAAAARAGRSVFLLGGNPGAADGAAIELRRLDPSLKIAGTFCPPFGFEKDPQEMRRINDALAAANPDIVFVGLGFPKQERLIEILRPAFPRAWFLGVGVSFSFVSGQIKRAPRWLQKLGLEWVHRMAQEPSRLFRRYVLQDLPFALRLFAVVSRQRFRVAKSLPVETSQR